VGNGTVRSEWNFDDTIRGTIAGMPIELDLGALDDEEEEWDLENEEVEVWDGTMRVREGSVIGGDLNTLNVSTSSSGVVNTDGRLRQCPYPCWTVPINVQLH
jgi:serine/threonine-protein kinase 24/25/MST4